MLDSGTMHSFVCPRVVKSMGVEPSQGAALTVTMANGNQVLCCRGLHGLWNSVSAVCERKLKWNSVKTEFCLMEFRFHLFLLKKILQVPFPFVSVKANFKNSVKSPFPLAAACFHTI